MSNNFNRGRTLERRTTIDPRRKRIIATDMRTGTETEFLGLPACEDAGFIAANVSRCLNGKRNHHGGCTWRYA